MAFNLRNRSFLKEIDFEPRELGCLLQLAEALKVAKYAGTEGLITASVHTRAFLAAGRAHAVRPAHNAQDGAAAPGSCPRARPRPQSSGGGATRCMSITLSPRPVIRSTSPVRAAWSGSSARRVVVPGPTVTSQSSNSARSVEPA